MSDVIYVETSTNEIVVQTTGTRGPRGEDGTGGGGPAELETFTAIVSSAQDVWEFFHELGRVPSVTTYDPAGQEIAHKIAVNTEVMTRLEWYFPTAGSVSLV